MMDDGDFYGLAAMIAGLALLGILQTKILRHHADTIADLRSDVEFLKTYAREMEARDA
jgi:hypothetical protein